MDDAYTACRGVPLAVNASSLASLLANDIPTDPCPSLSVSALAVTSPLGAGVALTFTPDGSFVLTPPADFAGLVTLFYT